MRRFTTTFFALALVPFFLSCGGGESNSNNDNKSSNSTAGAAQGVYSGTASSGYTLQTILLPDDRFYSIYGLMTIGNTFSISGLMTGQGSSNNGSYTSTYNDHYYSGVIYTGSLNAKYVAGTSFNGNYTENGGTYTFNATALPASSFDYNTPATLSTIAGTWNGNYLDGSSGSVTVSSTGTFSGFDQGCSYNGSLTPDSSGKNFSNVSVTYGASPCVLPNQTGTGIAINYLLSDGVHRQLLVGVTSGNFGTVFAGTK